MLLNSSKVVDFLFHPFLFSCFFFSFRVLILFFIKISQILPWDTSKPSLFELGPGALKLPLLLFPFSHSLSLSLSDQLNTINQCQVFVQLYHHTFFRFPVTVSNITLFKGPLLLLLHQPYPLDARSSLSIFGMLYPTMLN